MPTVRRTDPAICRCIGTRQTSMSPGQNRAQEKAGPPPPRCTRLYSTLRSDIRRTANPPGDPRTAACSGISPSPAGFTSPEPDPRSTDQPRAGVTATDWRTSATAFRRSTRTSTVCTPPRPRDPDRSVPDPGWPARQSVRSASLVLLPSGPAVPVRSCHVSSSRSAPDGTLCRCRPASRSASSRRLEPTSRHVFRPPAPRRENGTGRHLRNMHEMRHFTEIDSPRCPNGNAGPALTRLALCAPIC